VSLFVEYVGDYPQNGSSAQLLNWGGLYRLTPNQQVDFHVALGSTTMRPVTSSGSDIRCVFDELFPVRRSSPSIALRN